MVGSQCSADLLFGKRLGLAGGFQLKVPKPTQAINAAPASAPRANGF
jgi:hypothetical protein